MSWLSHDPHKIYNHLITLLCNGIQPFSKSTSVKGSTESTVLQEAFRHGWPIPHRQDMLEGLWITDSSVPPQQSSGIWLMTSHNPVMIFMIHHSCSIFRPYILALAIQGPTRFKSPWSAARLFFLMISFLYCSCCFIHSHDPLLFHYLYQCSHTPFCSFPFGKCFSFWECWDYLTGDASGPLPLYILVVVSGWVSLVLLSQEFLCPSLPQCD